MVRFKALVQRFPRLTKEQREELARRRVWRALQKLPYETGEQFDAYFALGYLKGVK